MRIVRILPSCSLENKANLFLLGCLSFASWIIIYKDSGRLLMKKEFLCFSENVREQVKSTEKNRKKTTKKIEKAIFKDKSRTKAIGYK